MKNEELYGDWLQSRRDEWRRISASIRGTRRDRSLDEAREVLDGYRSVARDLALARRQVPGSALHNTLEALYLQTHAALHRRPVAPLRELWTLYGEMVPASVRSLRGEITVTVSLFLLTALAGFALVMTWRETAQLFMSDQMMLMVQNRQLWTDDLLNVVPSSVLSVDLMTNNITVALTALALGLVYGLGTLYIITLNGLMLGAVFGYTAQFQMALPLFRFIVAHGLVELTVICLAAAAGLALGRALARPDVRGRAYSMQETARHAGALAAVCVPFLIGSGMIEGYVSPNENFHLASRVVIGVLWFVLLLAVLDGRLLNGLRQTLRLIRNWR